MRQTKGESPSQSTISNNFAERSASAVF
ncbi:hypothetical protein MTR67_001959 [Solanum verrucosum]|uniref:Uncharacterized protein n=1 Tax=Solanum verrucosum TaxID=315347 RepID=A0AAF0T8B3_SOLVR|nr:hypothetical protein MTR67_001959 [Solanum verrucosum]